MEDGLGHHSRGVVHGQQYHEPGSPVLQPGMGAAVHLNKHPLLGHALPAEPVLLRPAAAGTAQAGLHQDAAHRGTAQVDPLPFLQQFGEVAVVGAGVAVAGQFHHSCRCLFGHGVVGPPSPVAVRHRRGTVFAVGRQQTLGVTLTDSHDFRCLGDGQVVFQNAVEYLDPGLFLLFQCHFPHEVTAMIDPSHLGSGLTLGVTGCRAFKMICRLGAGVA